MSAALLSRPCRLSVCLILASGILCGVATPAAAQPAMEVPDNLGTFGIGEIQWALVANGGDPSCDWTVTGDLPPGVSLRDDVPSWHPGASAILMGVATTPGIYDFTLFATCGALGTAERPTQMTITSLRLGDPGGLPSAYASEPYTYTFTGLGNVGAITWALAEAPLWLSINAAGVLSGTPPDAGYSNFSVTIAADGHTVTRGFGLYIHPAMHITSSTMPNAARGVAYTAQVAATGGTAPYAFAITGGGLPNGLTMDAAGAITGTPDAGPGRYHFQVTVTDTNLATHVRDQWMFVVATPAALPSIQPHGGRLDDCTVGVPCAMGLYVQNGGVAPFTWVIEDLPEGFWIRDRAGNPDLAPGEIEIVGAGATADSRTLAVTVTGFDGQAATQTFAFTVSPLALRTESTTSTIGLPFSSRLYVLGGTGPYAATITAGPLPAGLDFNPGSLTVSGTPLESGGFHVDFRVSDTPLLPDPPDPAPPANTLDVSQHYHVNETANISINMGPDLGFVTTGWEYRTQLWACCAPSGYTWTIESGTLPTGMGLTTEGELSGTPTNPGVHTFLVRATENGAPANTTLRQLTLRVTPLSIVMDTRLATGFTTRWYSAQLDVEGAAGAVTWEVAYNSYLPPGLSLENSGGVWTLSGMPTASGQYDFSLTVRDSTGHQLTRGFSVSVYPFGVTPPVQVNLQPNLGTWSVGDLQYALSATGGDGTYVWSIVSGALPPGVSLRADVPSWYGQGPSGLLMGVATAPGVYAFTLRASSGGVHTDQACTMTITALRFTDRWWPPHAFVNEAYSFALTATGNAGPLVWSVGGSFPPGLSLTPAGVITGTPTAAGHYWFNIGVTDGQHAVNRGFQIDVFDVHLSTNEVPGGTPGATYDSLQFTASGGTGEYTFGYWGQMPAGLSLSSSGLLSGVIASYAGTGRYNLTVTVADSLGRSYSRNYALLVRPSPPTLPGIEEHGGGFDDCTVYVACSRGLFVWTGSVPPLTWQAAGLPPGLSLATTPDTMNPGATMGDAEITGVPTTVGDYLITITVTDASGASATQLVPLRVSPMGLWHDNVPGTVGEEYSAGLFVAGGVPPYSLTIVSGKLPEGLALDGAGRITGTPLESGGFGLRLRGTDAAGETLQAGFHINIGGGASTITVHNYWDLGTITTQGPYSNQLSACCAPTYEWSLVSGEMPPGMSLTTGGLLTGTPALVGTYNFVVQAAEVGNASNVGLRAFRLIVTPITIQMNTTLPTGFVDTAYTVPLAASGGGGSITWQVAPFHVLPPGLSLKQPGGQWSLAGTPAASGLYSFELIASDGTFAASRWFTVSIYPAGVTPPVAITTGPDLGSWSVGEVQAALYAEGGNGTYAWTLVGGELPPGLSLRADVPPWFGSAKAGIMGIATVPGPYTFTLRVTSGTVQFERTFTVRVTSLRSGETLPLPDAYVGQPYAYTLRAEGATGQVSWALDPGAPVWVGLTGDGVLSGTPPAPGWYHIPLQVSDAVSTIHISVGVQVNSVRVTSGLLPNAVQNQTYSAQVEATGGVEPYTFELNGGLPSGLTMDAEGAIGGSCNTGPGRYPFDVTVRDAAGASHRRTLTIFVTEVPARLPMFREHGIGLDDCTVFVPCQRGFWVQNGGVAPFSWSATGLPPGLSMRTITTNGTPGDGEIVGVPTATGTYFVNVTVTGADLTSSTQTFPLTVSPLAVRPDSTNPEFRQPFETTLRVLGGTGPYTGTIVTGDLPAGLSFNGATGVISGTPLDSSGTHVVYRFTDGLGQTVTQSFGLHVGNPPGLWINSGADLGYPLTGSPYNNQLWACCAPGYVWSAMPSTLPPGLTLSSGGLLSGTPSAAGVFSFLVSVADAANLSVVVTRRFTMTTTPLSPRWTGEPTGNVGTAYSLALEATGATGAITWTVAPYSYLPPGLSLAQVGGVWTLSGTPTASGQYAFNLLAEDEAGHRSSLGINVSVYPEGVTPPVRITQWPSTGTWSIGDMEHPLVATGGDGTYTWQVLSGTLPPGLSLRKRPDLAPWFSAETTGSITGIATVPGTYAFTLRVTSGGSYADQACAITITSLRGADNYRGPEAFVGREYAYQLQALGNAGPVTFTRGNNPLPAGLSMDAAGLISGEPEVSGYYHIDYSMSDGVHTVGRWVSISVFDVAIGTPGHLPNALQNTWYSTTIAASGGTGPLTFTQNGGMPGGLTLSAAGVITGTVNAGPGHYGFNVTATDANHVSYTRRMAITVVGVPKRLAGINPSGWNDCTVGVPCTLGLYIHSGGVAPFAWSATGLPDGMSIRTAGPSSNQWATPGEGEIFGVPSAAGTFNIEVSLTDADGAVTTNTFAMRVSPLMARDFDGSGTRGEPFEAFDADPPPTHYRRIRVTGGSYTTYPSYTATILSGRLPAGLTLDPATQTVSGTPLENGSFGITLEVRDTANPANTLVTSQGLWIGGGTTTIGVNNNDLGVAAIGQPFSYQLGACCIPTPYLWSVEPPASMPAGLGLDSSGRITGTPTGPAGTATFLVRAADSTNPNNYGIRLLTLTLVPSVISVSTNVSLPFANVGVPYEQALVASGGPGALTWSVEAGSFLPPGLTLAAAGVLSGTPTMTGSFRFTVRVTSADGSYAVPTFTIEVYPSGQAPPLGLNIGTSWTLQVGVFTTQLTQSSATGGVGPYTFSLTPEVDLPPGAAQIPGMRVQNGGPYPTYFSPSATAGYMGVVAEPGLYHPSLRVTDSRGVYADQVLTVSVQALTILSSPTLPRATANVPYFFAFEPYGGTTYTWSATNLPPGLTVDAVSGEITGTPSASGSFSPSITVTDLVTSASVSMGFTLAVDPFAITTGGVLPPATSGVPYSQALTADCGGGCTWSLVSGGLPGGLSLNQTTGVISGTPSGPDHRSFTVRATGSNGTSQKVFSLVTSHAAYPAVAIPSNLTLMDVTVGQVTSAGLFGLGGAPPYTWTIESGTLPAGVTLVGSPELYSAIYAPGTYYLRGRAMEAGTFVFTLRVTDRNGSTATRAFTWTVSRLSFQYASLPVGTVPLRYGEPYSQALLVLGGSGEYPAWTSLTPMPPGLVLDSGTGVVTGSPAFTGGVNATVRAADSEGHAVTRSVSFNAAGPTSTTLNFASGSTLGPVSMGSTASFNVTPSGAGSTPPYTVTAVTDLPPGFTLVSGSDGVLGGPAPGGVSVMGVATTPGTFFFTLEAQDSAPVPNVGARTFALSVYPFSPFVNTTLPDVSVGTAYEQPLVVFDNTGPATWSIVPGSALPPGLSLITGSLISGTPTTAGTYSFALVATDASGLTNTFTFTLKVSSITIAGDTVLPAVTTGVFYSHTFVATGADGTPTWTATGVPPGLTLSSAGVLSGTRTSGSGSVTLVVTATSGSAVVTRRFLLPSILPNPGVLSVPLWSTALSDAIVGQNVSYNLTATDGVPPYAWGVAPGSVLPPGLQLVAGTALIGWNPGSTALAGLPSVPGDYVFDLVATDAVGRQARRTFTLRVTPIGLIGNTSFTVTAGTGWTSKFIAVGGTPPYVFSASPVSWTQDMLPPGFALSPDGVVSGVTSSTGGYNFLLRVVDAAGLTLTRQVTVTVNSPTLIRVLGSNPSDTWVGGRIRFALNAADTTPTTPAPPNPVCTWSLVAGSLPPGVSLIRGLLTTQPNVTYLSGVPSEPGVYTFTVRATMDAAPTRVADHAYTFKVGSTQMVSPPWALPNILDLPGGEVGAPYTFTFKLAGGRAPYTFQPFPFDPLPPGLALSADGVLSGTPVRSGSYSVSTLVTDADGHSMAIGGLTLIVVPSGGTAPLIRPIGTSASPASVGVPYGFGLDIMLRGGTPPFVWSVASGSTLPPGLQIVPGANGVTSYLAGVATADGTFTFQLTVADSGGQTLTTTVGLTVSVLALSPDPLPPARVGVPYAQGLTASGGTAPYVVQRGSLSDLPPGLSFAGGVLSGTPTTPGIFVMQFVVTDAVGNSLTRSLPVFVDNAAGDLPTLTLSPRPIAVAYDAGTPGPAAVPVTVATTSGAVPVSLMVGGIAGASLSATTGTTPVTTNIGLEVSSLAPGIYTGLLAAAAPTAANLGDFTPVTLTVCGHTLFPQAGSVPSSGGQGTFNVASGGTCAWTATASATWITITGGGSGTGNGTVSYSVASNPSADPRTGTITIGGATYTITQFGSACTYTVQPAAGSVPNTGGAGAFAVSTNGTCAWTAVSSAGWLTVTGGGAGVGNATVTYSATANTSPDARSATITVNGALHTVTQFGTACSFAISPAGVNATAAGGMATVLLSASSSQCAWSASSADLGVTPASGLGTATLQVTVPPTELSSARWLTATIAGQPFTVYQTGSNCFVTLSSSTASVPAGASAGSVDVTTQAGCSYDTVPGPSWITVTAGGSGVGNGTLSYTVEPNSTTYSRTGSLTIGGQGFTITQAPLACSVTLNTSGLGSPFGPSAATGLIALTANGANCSWTASSDVPWASVTPAGGSGNRTLTVSVTSNAASTVARSGALTIAGQTVGLSQAGTACTYALESTSASASASGGNASVRVIAPSVCGWTASSQASWLTITSSGSAGTSAVSFVVAPNPAATPRTGTLTVAGLTYTVEQAGAPCSYSITGPPASETHPADGAPGVTFGFTASAAGCAPTAVSYASWITVTATTFGGTTGSVTYAVAPNPFGTTRTGTILVGNALFTVTQSGASCAYSLNAYGKVFRMAGGADTLLGSATASVCSPVYGTDQLSFITLGGLTGPVLNVFSLPYTVSPFASSLTAVVRTGRITFGGQILTIKQLSW